MKTKEAEKRWREKRERNKVESEDSTVEKVMSADIP
jgi:hypothetical protein